MDEPDDPPLGGERVLIVDDEPGIREPIRAYLSDHGFACESCGTGEEALQALGLSAYVVVLTDLRMPGMDGLQLIRAGRERSPETIFVLMTAYATMESAVDALRLGAADYLMKPIVFEDLLGRVRRIFEHRRLHQENTRLRELLSRQVPVTGLIGDSPSIRALRELVARFGPTDRCVLITGESGTGKELVARALHAASPRAACPFLAVNCAAIPETLLEPELFGYRKGAFSGADRDREGLFAITAGGTVFLDEVGELSRSVQAKLLRVLEERLVLPLGADRPRAVDVRVLAATNRDLEAAITEGSFREDLFFRLNVLAIRVPPLRERSEDIPALVHHFVRKHGPELRTPVREVGRAALDLLRTSSWRGNVRELENVVQRALILSRGPVLETEDLASTFPPGGALEEDSPPAAMPGSLRSAVLAHELALIRRAVEEAGGDKTAAARRLGISVASLYAKLKAASQPGDSEAGSPPGEDS